MAYIQRGLLQEGIAELEQAVGFWDPKGIRLGWGPLYWEDLAEAYRQAGRLHDAIAAYETAQFFRFSVHPYLRIQLAIGETYREQGDYTSEIDAYVRAVNMLSARGRLGPQDQDMLRKLARHAAVSYERQGLMVEEALAAHQSLVEADDHVSRAYARFFQQEIEQRLP
jgi:tetratricopeptide (TPR) repeat protein